jgi:TolB-like protein/DNA-binding winged helix-turn-helix (wHTH) protein
MIPARPLPSIAVFGPYTVDLQTGEIRKFGLRLKTGEQPFQILVLLMQRRGQLVTRDEIRHRLWGNKTFVDFDHSLNSAIQRLRDCLSDSAGNARWIETVPRRGYRFIAPVEWREAPVPAPTPPGVLLEMPAPAATPVTSPERPGFKLTLVAGLFILLLVGYRAISGSATEPPPSIHSLAVLPLENVSGEPAQDSLAAELTDDLTTALAKESSIRIVSRTSAMRFKGSHRQVREIARELGVDAVVEGSVARSGNKLHATTRLIDCRSDAHIWAGGYDRDLREMAPLLTEIARTIASYTNTAPHEK